MANTLRTIAAGGGLNNTALVRNEMASTEIERMLVQLVQNDEGRDAPSRDMELGQRR